MLVHALSLAVTITAGLCNSVPANEIHWTNPSGGQFNDPDNWSGEGVVPGADDTAVFDLDATFNLFNSSPPNDPVLDRLVFRRGQVQFLLLNSSLTVQAAPSSTPAFVIGDEVGDDATLTLSAATSVDVDTTSLAIGWGDGSVGSLWIASPLINVDVESDLFIGAQGQGMLHIDADCVLDTLSLRAGWSTSGTAGVFVDGGALTIEEAALFGMAGASTVEITDGGIISADDVTLGLQATGTSSLLITGDDSTLAATGNFEAGVQGSAEIRIEDGGHLWVPGAVMFGTFPPEENGAAGGSATVYVDGPASRITVLNDLWLGVFGHAELIISNGGRLDIAGDLMTASPQSSITVRLAGDQDFMSPAVFASGSIDPFPVAVELDGEYVPSIGAHFALFFAGEFLAVHSPTLPLLPAGRAWSIEQDTNSMSVRVVANADLNGDDTVGFPDLLILLDSWGPCSSGGCVADFDDNGMVNLTDLMFLLAEWS